MNDGQKILDRLPMYFDQPYHLQQIPEKFSIILYYPENLIHEHFHGYTPLDSN